MNNSPLVNADPQGDSPILIGAAIGFLSNGIGNVANGENFFKGGLQAAAFGAIGGGVSSAIGGVASGISNGFARGAFQFGAHALSGGALSAAQGGNFWQGAAAGGISSGVSSGIGGGNDLAQWLGGGLSGGIGSSIASGSFWDGVGQGLITGGLNHAAHQIGTSWLVDKELRKAGLSPKESAPFEMGSVDKVGALPSIEKLKGMHDNSPNVKLVNETGASTYYKGTMSMRPGDFSSWRRLAAAFGHEYVHYINAATLSSNMRTLGYKQFPHYYNELLAHSWSAAYTGIGGVGVLSYYTLKTIKTYPGLIKHYNKHIIKP